jgi:Zn-dependent peptidase ImmA (M78 family)
MSDPDSVAARVLGKLDSNLLRRIAVDPVAAAVDDFKCELRELNTLQSRNDNGTCDGFSFLDRGVIYYRPTWTDRKFFTIAHELAHLLVERDDDAMDWIAGQPGPSQLERVCDAMAGRMLIPNDLLKSLGTPPTARNLALIHDTTNASRSACAIRIAQRLPCDGFVAIVDASHQSVYFASRHEDTRPYAWQGDPVPDPHELRHIGEGQERNFESSWPFRDGERERFYLSSYREGDWIFAIFAEEDLWQVASFHAPQQRRRETRPELRLRCWNCDYDGTFHGYPCQVCGQPFCPKCQLCDCDRKSQHSAVCAGCGFTWPRQQIQEGLCNDCRS